LFDAFRIAPRTKFFLGVHFGAAASSCTTSMSPLSTEPIQPSEEAMAVLQIFASRGALELQGIQTKRELQKALAEVERLRAENVYCKTNFAPNTTSKSSSVRASRGNV
jgi:hypothetical protein